jgi:hypothetical protein
VNIEEKLADESNQPLEKKIENQSNKKTMTEEEKKELRRKQQERALQFQMKINEQLKSSRQIKPLDDDEQPDDEDFLENSKSKETYENSFMDKLQRDFEQMDVQEMRINVDDDKSESEKYESEFNQMLSNYDKTIDKKNNKFIEKEFLLDLAEKNKTTDLNKPSKTVKWQEESNKNDIAQIKPSLLIRSSNDSDDEDEEVDDENNNNDVESEKESFENSQEIAPHRIQIRHTKNDIIDEMARRRKLTRSEPTVAVDSPADIYLKYYKPKSILKSNERNEALSEKNAPVNVKFDLKEEKRKKITANSETTDDEFKFEPNKVKFQFQFFQFQKFQFQFFKSFF